MSVTEVRELADGHRLTITTGPDGQTRYTCSCRKLVDGDIDAAHFHSDLVTP